MYPSIKHRCHFSQFRFHLHPVQQTPILKFQLNKLDCIYLYFFSMMMPMFYCYHQSWRTYQPVWRMIIIFIVTSHISHTSHISISRHVIDKIAWLIVHVWSHKGFLFPYTLSVSGKTFKRVTERTRFGRKIQLSENRSSKWYD